MRFYTLPPRGVEWPYLLVNPRNYKELFKRKFEHAILDSGVLIFLDPKIKDYPKWFIKKYPQKAKGLTEVFGDRLWVTIPDLPDDHNPGQFGDNVSKTLERIEHFVTIDGVNWLPVIQSRYLNRFSFLEACQRTYDLIGDYPRVAIGTVCKCRRLDFIEYCSIIARRFFPNSWIHAFGLTLRALPRIIGIIDSFDSLAYSFRLRNGYGNLRAKTHHERVRYFYAYIRRIEEILGLEGLGHVPQPPEAEVRMVEEHTPK